MNTSYTPATRDIRKMQRYYQPYDDELVTFTGVSAQVLTASKIAGCSFVVIRFISGNGWLRFTNQAAAASQGVPVYAGDIETMSRFEAANLQGIRDGATNLVGWATYYR